MIETSTPEDLDPVKKLDDYQQEFLKQEKRPQDITVDNTIEKVQEKVLDVMESLSKLWVMVE